MSEARAPAKPFRHWTNHELRSAQRLRACGETYPSIGDALNRTPAAVRMCLRKRA